MQSEVSQTSAIIPNSCQWNIKNLKGDSYLIQAAWPLAWDTSTKKGDKVPVFYVLDGNAYFFGTVEAVRRNGVLPGGKDGIVIGIGYPQSKFPFDARRNVDLTPPSPHYTAPSSPDGKIFMGEHGGATKFIEFLVNTVREFLFAGPFSRQAVSTETLVGHSYGGLCTLHALFTRSTPFHAFVAVSPSIWWNNRFLLSEQESFLSDSVDTSADKDRPRPSLFLSYGSYEQAPRRLPTWTDDEYRTQTDWFQQKALGENAGRMYGELKTSHHFEEVRLKVYQDEDHLSVAMCGINWAISCIVDRARFE
ncbi:uncharacterized protein A1O9_07526 [Exophiala aquamarina CBS 119918]|uniref:Esterase n=1 Tax=Exophiala aquamarina CBS 119918 TaxID=1182545 RepID=A0A072P7W0_9EURO|nr:uncharacterized protein A1O9_07526 [Exophiala aquamarina CBS 119918]KEF55946.1 hypothetical protein A1O9_07526 [Exophiala aquamarina CBS 119918]